jgi:ATP-binding cassette subfamily B protein
MLFWGFDHYVVLEGFDKGKAYISDPDRGRHSLSFQEFREQFTGVAFEFTPSADFQPGGSKPTPFRDLIGLLTPFRLSLFTVILIATALTVPTFMVAALSAQFVDSFLQNRLYYFGIPIIWLSLLSIALLILLNHLQLTVLRRIELVFSRQITTTLFYKLFSCPLSFYQQRLQGELASRMLLGLEMTQLVVAQIIRFLASIWSSLLLLVLAWLISSWLALLAVVSLLSNVIFNVWITRSRDDDNKKLAISQGKVGGLALQGISNLETIKASGIEFDFLDNWQTAFDDVQDQTQKLGSQLGLSTVAASGSTYLLSAITITLGAGLILLGQLSLGELTAFQFIQQEINAPINLIPQFSTSIQTLQGTLGRLQDLFSVDTDPYARGLEFLAPGQPLDHPASDIQEQSIEGELELRNISFRYSNSAPMIFEDLNLRIAAGSKITLVGRTGCGKSTLIRLLAGLTAPTSGEVLLDGRPYLDVSNDQLRSAIAYVPQEVFVFNASFWDNLTVWRPGYDRDEVIKAARMAQIHDTIISHPEGYERVLLDNGADLSGGQRQRLEIARALIRQPKVIILDEATSALDNETERKVFDSIWSLGITTVTIAHRLTAALKSDLIVVMNNGMIEQQGSPQQLLAQEGLFKDLYNKEQLVTK